MEAKLCPRCGGEGKVEACPDLFDGRSVYLECSLCKGAKIVPVERKKPEVQMPTWVTINMPYEVPPDRYFDETAHARGEYQRVINEDCAKNFPVDPDDVTNHWPYGRLDEVQRRAPEVRCSDGFYDSYYLSRVMDKYPNDPDVIMLAKRRHRSFVMSQYVAHHPATKRFETDKDRNTILRSILDLSVYQGWQGFVEDEYGYISPPVANRINEEQLSAVRGYYVDDVHATVRPTGIHGMRIWIAFKILDPSLPL